MAGGRLSQAGATLAGVVWCATVLFAFVGATLSTTAGPDHVSPDSSNDVKPTGESNSGRPPRIPSDAIERLSKVFGLDRVPVHRHHRSPPQYMLDLYNTVAYRNGITRTQSPYGSDVVRGFPDRDATARMHFYFNVSYINQQEEILEGEFHVFKLRPRPPEPHQRHPRGVHLIEVRLYQVLDPARMYTPDGVKLLDFRRVSTYAYGWEVFKVKETIQQWINDSSSNNGFMIVATTRGGTHHVNGSYVRFAQRSEHHDSKQPVLVVFTEDKRMRIPPYASPSESDILEDYTDIQKSRKRGQNPTQHNSYIQFLNERHRAQHGNYRIYPATSRTHQQATASSGRYQPRLVAPKDRRRRAKRSVEYYNFPRKRKQTCSRQELYVDFDEIGWSGWIISPKGYNAYHCKGDCPFPLGQNQKPTNHATVQSIVHALRIGKDVGTPCCVPNKLYSISLLYFDDDENVILKQYDDMVAASCGCH